VDGRTDNGGGVKTKTDLITLDWIVVEGGKIGAGGVGGIVGCVESSRMLGGKVFR